MLIEARYRDEIDAFLAFTTRSLMSSYHDVLYRRRGA